MKNTLTFIRHYLKTRYGLRFPDRLALENHQQRRLAAFRADCLRKSPFYKDYAAKDLFKFPLMNKTLMMENFDDINTKSLKLHDAMTVALRAEESRDFKATLNGITVGLSSGTSGSRGLFAVSREEQAIWAGTILARVLGTSILDRHKLAFFLRAGSNLYDSVQRRGRISFRFFDLTLPFGHHLSVLNNMQPTQIIAPAQTLRLIAEAQKLGKIDIMPRRVTSVAEVLDPLDEQYISAAFGQPVGQVYQCTEGFLGYTCQHNRIHLNEEYLFIEKEWIEKSAGRFMPIITDFTRFTQPMVRYRLDDILVLDERPCPCGNFSTVVSSIEGRMDDVIYGSHAVSGKAVPLFPDVLRHLVVRSSPRINDYRIVQENPALLRVDLEDNLPETDFALLAAHLYKAFADHGCIPPSLIRSTLAPSSLLRKKTRITRLPFPIAETAA